jgi:hypothetical protein
MEEVPTVGTVLAPSCRFKELVAIKVGAVNRRCEAARAAAFNGAHDAAVVEGEEHVRVLDGALVHGHRGYKVEDERLCRISDTNLRGKF